MPTKIRPPTKAKADLRGYYLLAIIIIFLTVIVMGIIWLVK
jgi:hypothetical protein